MSLWQWPACLMCPLCGSNAALFFLQSWASPLQSCLFLNLLAASWLSVFTRALVPVVSDSDRPGCPPVCGQAHKGCVSKYVQGNWEDALWDCTPACHALTYFTTLECLDLWLRSPLTLLSFRTWLPRVHLLISSWMSCLTQAEEPTHNEDETCCLASMMPNQGKYVCRVVQNRIHTLSITVNFSIKNTVYALYIYNWSWPTVFVCYQERIRECVCQFRVSYGQT
jgi:hypothetical protein